MRRFARNDGVSGNHFPNIETAGYSACGRRGTLYDNVLWERDMLTDAEVQAHADRIRGDGFTVIEAAANPELS